MTRWRTKAEEILALYKDGSAVQQLNEGELGVVVLDHTPFYAESGGQAGDGGVMQAAGGMFAVEDTLKIQAQVFGHHGVVKTGSIKQGERVQPGSTNWDVPARCATTRPPT